MRKAFLFLALLGALTAQAASSSVVVSQVYGGGGNTGATYKNDFVELHNISSTSISVAGWSVQYASGTGTSWQVTNLSGTIPAGGYYLVQEAAGTGGTLSLSPDATGSIAMSGTAGKIALVSSTTALTSAAPTGPSIVDFVGYGTTATTYEGTGPTPAPSNTTSVSRKDSGSTDTDNNATDFTAGALAPRNSATPPYLPSPTASQVRVETAANGGGITVPTQTIAIGSNNTVFAVTRTTSGTFVANAPATWSLTSLTGGIVASDLTAASDGKSSTFTPHAAGSAVIRATISGLTSVDSAVLTAKVVNPVTIFHMNDTHARVTPHWWVIPDHNAGLEPKFDLVGGAAYLGAEVLSLTAANPNSLVIDGGDISEGNPIGDMGGNGTMVRFYRLLSQKLKATTGRSGRGIDAAVVGNHDVRDATYIANLKNQTDFTPISVNVCNLGTTTPYFAPYVVVNVNGTRVGILGYTTQAAEVGASLASTLTVVDCDWNGTAPNVIHLADYVNELRTTQGCDLVVLAAHVGHSAICTDTGPSGAVKAILVDSGPVKLPEVAMTGHWHTWADTVWQPEVLNYKTLFAESSSYMHYVGEVQVSGSGQYLGSAQHVVRCADITPDPDINALLDTLKAEYAAANPTKPIAAIVGYTGDHLLLDNYMKWWSGNEYPWTGDNTAGEWICDAVQWNAANLFGHCDLALEAGGGVRADIPKGPVTYLQVYETFPWVDDTYVQIKMTGQEIYNYFKEHNCNAAFSRGWVVTVENGMPTTIAYNSQPIGLATSYDVAINNYMYANDSHVWVDKAPRTNPTLVRDSLIEYMKLTTTADAPYRNGGPRFAINTEFSGGYRAVVTLLNDHDSKTSYEAAYLRLLSATPETLARRGGKQVPADLVNSDGSIAPAHPLSEIQLYRSYLGFKQGALQPGDIIETWGKGSFYDGEPEFVDQEGIYADGVEFKIVGHDASLAQPTFMPSIGAFWDDNHKNHFVRFLARKAGADTVTDQFGQTIKVWDETAYAAYALPGNTGDLLVLTGLTSVKNFGLRFCGASAALASAQGFTTFPVTSSLASQVDPLAPGTFATTLTLTASATSAGTTGIVLSPVADTQVASGSPTNNYGSGSNVYLQSSNSGSYQNERTWLRFDLSSLPAGSTVTGATLELYCWKATGAALPASVSGSSTDTWTETGLNWSNQPAFGSVLTTRTLAAGTTDVWYTWDVTSFVQSEFAGDKVVSLVAKAVTEDSSTSPAPSYGFDAKEYGSNGPVLRVTTAATSGTTVANVQYFYRFSANGSAWGSWTSFATANAAPYSATFNYPQGFGYYEFYTRATDSLGAVEAAPLAADAAVHHTDRPAYDTVAIIRLGDLTQTYTGAARPVTAITIPGGLNLAVTYNGAATVPVHAGLYTVAATVTNSPGYTGAASATLTVARATQSIPLPALGSVPEGSATFALPAAASSGLPVSYSSSNSAVATVAGNLVTVIHAGTTTITATQNGSGDYYAATDVSQPLTVTAALTPDSGDVPLLPTWALALLAGLLVFVAMRSLPRGRTQ